MGPFCSPGSGSGFENPDQENPLNSNPIRPDKDSDPDPQHWKVEPNANANRGELWGW